MRKYNGCWSRKNPLEVFTMNRKAQGAIEFLIIFSAMFFFFIVFLLIIQNNVAEKNLEKENLVAINIALSVKDEIGLANGASEGYYRQFNIPQNLLGKDYNIEIIDQRVFISAEKIGISYLVLDVTGTLVKGTNTIRKENGNVLLNS